MRRAFALLCLLALPACATDSPETDAMFRISDDSGSLNVALLGRDSHGRTYRLRKATFELSGNAMITLHSRESDDLHTPLPQGHYQMYLRPGYELVERGADGAERVVEAHLSSPNPAHVHVAARKDGSVSLSFQGAQGEIAFGQARRTHARTDQALSAPTVLAASAPR